MNVTRNRRRLVAARRYAARQYLPGQTPGPLWDQEGNEHDSVSVLKLARNLAGHRYRTGIAQLWRDHVHMFGKDDSHSCDGWNPPCGGCSRCIWAQTLYYAKGLESARKAYWRTNYLLFVSGRR